MLPFAVNTLFGRPTVSLAGRIGECNAPQTKRPEVHAQRAPALQAAQAPGRVAGRESERANGALLAAASVHGECTLTDATQGDRYLSVVLRASSGVAIGDAPPPLTRARIVTRRGRSDSTGGT